MQKFILAKLNFMAHICNLAIAHLVCMCVSACVWVCVAVWKCTTIIYLLSLILVLYLKTCYLLACIFVPLLTQFIWFVLLNCVVNFQHRVWRFRPWRSHESLTKSKKVKLYIWVTLQSCVQHLHVFSNLYNIIYALHTRKTVIVTDL